MLPVYKAISIDKEAIHSGSTKPCLMTLENDKGELVGDYVVKVFKPKNLEQQGNTNKEVYGNILAKEFDFKVPKAVLVIVKNDIIDILNTSNKYRNFNLAPGIYFGTKYIENVLDFSEAVDSKLEDWEIENIFAFDVLIRNIDRHKKKPNLFFKNGEVFLIDHELSLNTKTMDKPFLEMFNDFEKYWNYIEFDRPDFKRKHLFLEELRQKNAKNPINFDTFEEYLRTLDVDCLDEYEVQLRNFGINTEDYPIIKSYLEEVKTNSELFFKLLKHLIK